MSTTALTYIVLLLFHCSGVESISDSNIALEFSSSQTP